LDIVTPTSPEYKKFLENNPEVSKSEELREFFSDYVQTILSEKSEEDPNKKNVTKKESELLELY
jgi:hypothetical protein